MRKVAINKIFAWFLILILLGCEHDKVVTPPEPRPEGWISLGLEDKTINRLVLTRDWLYACANKDGLFRVKHPPSPGDEWQFLGLGDLDVAVPGLVGVNDVVSRKDTIIAGLSSGNFSPQIPGIFRSLDDGRSWMASDSGFVIDEIYTGTGVVRRLVKSSLNPNTVVAGCIEQHAVYLSEDFGSSWKLSLSFEIGGGYSFHVIGLHPTREHEFWAGGAILGQFRKPLLYRSDDSGNTWQKVLEHPHDPYQFPDEVNDIAFDPENENTVYVCLDRIIIKTTDSGANWFTSLDTVDTGVFWNISSDPYEGNKLIACATDSLYHTTDGGLIWTTFESAPRESACDEGYGHRLGQAHLVCLYI
ncbi:MAG: WD40/YVTN/BNR-like repeat-containing protein [bacterium]